MHVNVLNRYGAYCRSDSLYTFAQCAAKACEVSDPKRPILAIDCFGIGPAGNCFLMGDNAGARSTLPNLLFGLQLRGRFVPRILKLPVRERHVVY